MKTGDLKPDLKILLRGSPSLDATTASSVRVIGKVEDTIIFDKTPTAITFDEEAGTSTVVCQWEPADTAGVWDIYLEVELMWPGAKPQSITVDRPVHVTADFDAVLLGAEPTPSGQVADAYVLAVLQQMGAAYEHLLEIIEGVGATGGAGGVLSGQFPNPGFAVNMVTQEELDTVLRRIAARHYEGLIVGTITRDPSTGAILSAPVVWPDGEEGTFTTDEQSASFLGEIDAYHITYGDPATQTYTQPEVTRDSSGAVTVLPAIVVT